jgi:hypothetical protein
MNGDKNHGSNWIRTPAGPPLPIWFHKLVAGVITLFMFCVFAIVADSFLINFPHYWRVCSSSVIGAPMYDILYRTVLSSFSAAIEDYAVSFYNPTYVVPGFVTAIYGNVRGRPPLVVPTVAWILVSFAFVYLSVSQFDSTWDQTITDWPYFMIGILLTVFCWFVSKRFW